MLCAAASLPAGGDRWCGTVYVSGSVCEELVEGPGLGRVIEQVRPDYVVIGESTSLGLYIGQRGRGEVVVETLGVPAHSSTPHLGENAVRKMAALLGLLDTIALPQDPLLGSALLELTDIISRPYPGISVVPDLCRATFDRRLLVGETPESVLSGLEAVIAGAGGGLRARVALAEARFRTYTGYEVAVPKFAPAWKTPEDHLLVQAARRGLARAGLPVRLGAYGFCTNGSYSAGKYGIPTIGFGPGNESEAHTVDEFVDLESLFAAVEGYRQLALAVCAPDRGDGRAATAPGRGSG
jgi:putative selenium metabolism hydrolase